MKQNKDNYVCVMFPYPSGSGLHVGHCYNYSIMDSYCRWLKFKGQTVFQPFGFDAYGLPAENYAKQVGGDPFTITLENIYAFRIQMENMNTDYEMRFSTCDPSYDKWTQWLFLKLKEHGLAYKAWGNVNWCNSCQTVLANEQAQNGFCDRCGEEVVDRETNQWYFKITDYKDRLIANLDKLDYPTGTIKQQRKWLENLNDWCVSRQRSWGCSIPIEGETDTLDTFVDSSFYYLRYLTDSQNEFLPKEDYKQVDLYVGGAEHACMHLIYARFIHMFLYDIGIVPEEEPFKKVIHQGMITKDGAKMSKSRGNTVSVDDYDPDILRMYLMFIGHYFDGGDWNDQNIRGIERFLKRINRWTNNASMDGEQIDLADLIDKLDGFVMSFKFNKVISTLMEFYNKNKQITINIATADKLKSIIRVFAPGFS